jgi:hypothetical protein
MFAKKSDYEALLAQYSDHHAVIDLLKQFRPYLERVPSMRRPGESVISIPLPLVSRRLERGPGGLSLGPAYSEVVPLPCDLGILMCDPEWKIKTGVEICVYICRPNEDFSELLGRWRETQRLLSDSYEWIMPRRYRHIMSDGAEEILPLFIGGTGTPERVIRGLKAAVLPFVAQQPDAALLMPEEYAPELMSGDSAITLDGAGPVAGGAESPTVEPF